MSHNMRKWTFWCAPNEDSNQPAHLSSLMKNTCILSIQNVCSEDSDQTLQMLRLIWIFAGHTNLKVPFDVVAHMSLVKQALVPGSVFIIWRGINWSQYEHRLADNIFCRCWKCFNQLTLVLLNKLRCHAHFKFQPIRLLDPDFCYKFTYLMANSADPDQLASWEANWSGATLFAKAGYIRVQQDKD